MDSRWDLGEEGDQEARREWNLEGTVSLLKLCKRRVILKEIGFLVGRLELKSFATDIMPSIHQMSQMLIPRESARATKKAIRLSDGIRKPTNNHLKVPTRNSSNRLGSLYSLIRLR